MLSLRHAKRIVSFILGLSLLLIGVAMIVLPGPATVLLPLGLGSPYWLQYSCGYGAGSNDLSKKRVRRCESTEGREKAPRRQGKMATGEERR